MISVTNIEVYGWESAIRGMRNPLNSWKFTDTSYDGSGNMPAIGKNDLKLMQTLSGAGSDHGKYLRMITVTCDIVAPLYWWKEFDTYKIGTVANSCSTMHKVHAKQFELDDFSVDHLTEKDKTEYFQPIIDVLNWARDKYLASKDKAYWWRMIQFLPSSYNQKRTVQFNYEVASSMYFARKEHKLDEWRFFCEHTLRELPYFEDIVIEPRKKCLGE